MATIAELQERLLLYKTTEQKILEGNQSWTAGGITYSRASLGRVQELIRELEARLEMAQAAAGTGAPSHSTAVFGGLRR
ncbi:MAG: hypothetical protein WCZ10_14345 [Desulfobulbaceae bacterium]